MTAKRKKGRPSKYNKKLGEKICMQIAQGVSLRQVCMPEGMPDRRTVVKWVLGQVQAEGIEDFRDNYARAREVSYELIFDEVLDIADDSANDYVDRETRSGHVTTVVDKEALQRSKLRIDTRLTVLERMRPKKYGKLTQTDLTTAGRPITQPSTEAKDAAKRKILEDLDCAE